MIFMTRLLTIIWLLTVFVLMTGCSHIKKTCSFRLDFIDDTPSDIADYSIVEVDSKELLRSAPWGIELYSDALTNANSMALITKESLRNYRLFLNCLSFLGTEELKREIESVRLSLGERLPQLKTAALLQKSASASFNNSYSCNEMSSLSRNLASWIWAARRFYSNLGSMQITRYLRRVYADGSLYAFPRNRDEDEIKRRLQSLAYGCILSEKCPDAKRLYVDERYKIRYVAMQHGRVPLPVRVDVVDERKFVFKDCNLTPFAELTMCFDYGYFGYFSEVNMDSKMVLDMAFRALLHRYNKGSRIKGEICHNLETGEIKVDVREFAK
jgi:hypothetical protein